MSVGPLANFGKCISLYRVVLVVIHVVKVLHEIANLSVSYDTDAW